MPSTSRPAHRVGLTLIELLTAISVMGILSALAIVQAGRMRESARLSQCAGRLRHIALALTVCARENQDRLPDNINAGLWAWDTKWDVIQRLGPPTELRDICYCPAAQVDDEMIRHYFQGNGFTTIGYVLLLPGTPNIDPTKLNALLTPQPYQAASGEMITPLASQRELAVDATISLGKHNFTFVQGLAPMPHRANHVNGSLPTGGNIAFLDGHVEWRAFAEMENHMITPGMDWRMPWFWW